MDDNRFRELNDEKQHTDNVALDDVRRVKVLSPSMLVFRRFIRNRLAIVGSAIIGFMFLFSFVGGWIMPYRQDQVFVKNVDMSKDFAAVTENTDFRFTTVDGTEFPSLAKPQFVLATNNHSATMSAQGLDYSIENIGPDFYLIKNLQTKATATLIGKQYDISSDINGNGFKTAFETALKSGESSFEYAGVTYTITGDKKIYKACIPADYAIASKSVFDYADAEVEAASGYDFKINAELAMDSLISAGGSGTIEFTADNREYELELKDDISTVYTYENGVKAEYANISRYIVQAVYPDIFLTIDYKTNVRNLISQGVQAFSYPDTDGTEREYTIERKNTQWLIKWLENTQVVSAYESPSWAHPLGTDKNGMDLLVRLMFGGRVSLMIGFIVVFIEVFLGVVMGGIAGYFKKYLDNLVMRIVDVFYSIPMLPLVIILGAMMDGLRVDPQIRMILLMVILGVLSWPGMARMVRGQILSLREQEFMVAAEASGLSASRRIFRHLVPNVIPQLIVLGTMDLGNVIILESTLSFLGLGVKFPFASWGNIINDVNNVHVLTSYPYVWIPAGMCILITVLGFNFVGDGLRDAFDPKMKR